MTFYGKKSHTYRRQLREEVSLHSTGDVIIRLFGEGVEVPSQPLPQLGEFGALVFPKEDEVRTDLARQSGMITRVELGAYVVCAAVTSLARACGISDEQLLSGAAHELQTHGTPLLTSSVLKNRVDHAASMKMLASSIHATPCPLPVPSSAGGNDDVTSSGQRPGSPPEAVPTKEELENPTAPVTPEAPDRYAFRVRQSSGFKPVDCGELVSTWPKWGVKMVCGRSTGQQIRLGAYNVEDDAAYAYAAAAYVIRRKDHIQHMKVLTEAEMAALDGCVRSDVRHLVKVRMWWRWRRWRTAMAEVGIPPGTPFPLENGGSRSPANSNVDDEGEYPLTQIEEAVDEEMQEPELA
ncbi:unnamed protein product [Closterium sp. Naga37s-1]|nr:unnamed protein product [Closterium sp. Naga37s-1]